MNFFLFLLKTCPLLLASAVGGSMLFAQEYAREKYLLAEGGFSPQEGSLRPYSKNLPQGGGTSDLVLKPRFGQLAGSELNNYQDGLGRLVQAAVGNEKASLQKRGLVLRTSKQQRGLNDSFPPQRFGWV